MAQDSEGVKEFYLTYNNDGSSKIINPLSGIEVTTQSNGVIWCTFAVVVEICSVCESATCDSEGFQSEWRIRTHLGPCPPDYDENATVGPGDNPGDGESTGGGGEGDGNNVITKEFNEDSTDEDDCVLDPFLSSRINGLADSALIDYINAYLMDNNNNSCEANSFISEGLDTIDEGGELDLENEIIFSNDFKQTRAYCVVKLLTDSNNNLFQDVVSTFIGDNAKSRIRFLYEPLYLTNGGDDTTTEANTSPPDPLGVITIRFNSFTNSAFANSLEIATSILHESIHANLFRIVEGKNDVPNLLSDYQYQYIVDLLEYYENNNSPMFITSNAQHTFMANFHVGNIAQAIRELDDNLYSEDHYKSFGWEGLSQIGTATNPPLVTNAELSNYTNLASIPLNDDHNLSCDE